MRNIPSDQAGKLALVKLIMARELTEMQRQTVEDYYLKGMTLEEIARERYVNKSTVQRTLKRGESRIRRFLLLEPEDCGLCARRCSPYHATSATDGTGHLR